MTARRVLLVNIRSLLMEGVEGLLDGTYHNNGKDRFEVVSTLADTQEDLVREIDQFNPNVIVVDENASSVKPAKLIAALLNTRRIRLVVLNSETSKMDIYDKRETVVSNPSHLIEALSERALSS